MINKIISKYKNLSVDNKVNVYIIVMGSVLMVIARIA